MWICSFSRTRIVDEVLLDSYLWPCNAEILFKLTYIVIIDINLFLLFLDWWSVYNVYSLRSIPLIMITILLILTFRICWSSCFKVRPWLISTSIQRKTLIRSAWVNTFRSCFDMVENKPNENVETMLYPTLIFNKSFPLPDGFQMCFRERFLQPFFNF